VGSPRHSLSRVDQGKVGVSVKEFDSVRLREGITKPADGETVTHETGAAICHTHRNGEAFEVEFFDKDGWTIGIATCTPEELEPAP
jgi:hypothetical protein